MTPTQRVLKKVLLLVKMAILNTPMLLTAVMNPSSLYGLHKPAKSVTNNDYHLTFTTKMCVNNMARHRIQGSMLKLGQSRDSTVICCFCVVINTTIKNSILLTKIQRKCTTHMIEAKWLRYVLIFNSQKKGETYIMVNFIRRIFHLNGG